MQHVLDKKTIALAVLFTGLLAGFIPYFSKNQRSSSWLACGVSFAGGVLLGAGLIHLLPDAEHLFRKAMPRQTFPLAPVFAGAGFFLVLLFEKVFVPLYSFSGAEQPTRPNGPHLAVRSELAIASAQSRPVLLLVALSFHSLLAGYALGEQTSLPTAAALLIAVLAHKGMAAFTLGVSLYRMNFKLSRAAKSLLFFACTTPLGIILGSATISVLADSSLWVGISEALAVGTFLYIAIADIVAEEFSHAKHPGAQWTYLVLGFISMGLLRLWI